jgi:hypothetical protein
MKKINAYRIFIVNPEDNLPESLSEHGKIILRSILRKRWRGICRVDHDKW